MATNALTTISVDKNTSEAEALTKILRELIEENRKQRPAKVGNPAVVGLAGFGLTTLLLQFHNIGWMAGTGPIVALGFVLGGLAQMIAGLQEFSSGNNFGYCVFTTYGAFWISLAMILVGNKYEIFKSSEEDVGFFLLAFTLYTAIMLIGSTRISTALTIVFILLLAGFVLLDLDHFAGGPSAPAATPKPGSPSGHELKHGTRGFKVAAGWVLTLCALGAWYIMAHLIYLDTFKRDVLPVGRAPAEIFSGLINRRRSEQKAA